MLKKRLIACLLIKDNLLVQSIGFEKYLPIGQPKFTVEFVSRWDVDEIILLDISATKNKKIFDLEMLSMLSEKAFVPLTVGGGIRSIDNVKSILNYGADKVCLNSYIFEDKSKIKKIAEIFGTQCAVVSIDAKKSEKGDYFVYSQSGKLEHEIKVEDWAAECESLGAGEIIINSIDRDGKKQGYDIELIKLVTKNVNIPVIAIGGVGKVSHFAPGINQGFASAVAAANIFLHSEHSTIITKSHLLQEKIDIRIDTNASYSSRSFDEQGRLNLLDSSELSKIKLESYKKGLQ